jgi:hypothetical protein
MIPTGVTVCMASHNSARFIRRALASIDLALSGRPYALVIADDASTDDTLRIAREMPTRAGERIIVGFPKAGCVGEAKNRAVKLAQPFFRKYPWVAFMDDDDEMLPGRFQFLLEQMQAEGQKAAVGDWIRSPEGGTSHVLRGDWSLRLGMYAPCDTLVHRDLIPRNGDYFMSNDRDMHEDFLTHKRMSADGVQWAYHRGAPIHIYHQRNDSLTGGPERSTAMLHKSEEWVSKNLPETRTPIRSFCTVAIGPSIWEAEILLRSLRISGNRQPVVVLTDEAGERIVRGFGLPDIETLRADPALLGAPFPPVLVASILNGAALNLGAFLGKMDVLTEAVKRHGSSLYLDADVTVLRRYTDVFDEPIGLTPELNRSCDDTEPSSWHRAEKFGHFCGGMVYVAKEALHAVDWWRREFLKTWAAHGSLTQSHGCFVDQSCLEMLPLFGPTHIFHPGHNLMYTRIPKWAAPNYEDRDRILRELRISVEYGMYFRGWPATTMHAHFRAPGWGTNASKIFRQVLKLSRDERHQEILSFIDRETPEGR